MDVDLPLGMGLGNVGGDDVFIVKALGTFRTVFQHGAHGGIRVDVGVFPLQVHVFRPDKGQGGIDLHQLVVHLPQLLMLGPVQDIGLGGFRVVGGDQFFLHHVLDLLHGGDLLHLFQLGHHSLGQLVQLLVGHLFSGVAHIGLKNSAADL